MSLSILEGSECSSSPATNCLLSRGSEKASLPAWPSNKHLPNFACTGQVLVYYILI